MIIYGGIILPLVAVVAAATSSACNTGLHNAQGINFWKLHHRTASASTVTSQQHLATPANREQQVPLITAGTATTAAEAVPNRVTPKFRAQTFTQPLDHFRNTTDATFQQRFWVNARHYKPRPGAPVIVIDGGETSGEDRLPFLDTGIADLLARATGGVGVVLEHRYYGACLTRVSLRPVPCPPPDLGRRVSYPTHTLTNSGLVGQSIGVQDLSTDSLRCAHHPTYRLYTNTSFH